eukprot:TRINITY_DN1112_c0_g1_i1.p1 TRINITY_DN1112_c0_g1~~TRINITY_DN1112_c0_g1_i1.p1  ORF type:complete len:195 (-),score=37.68 TRINITY_DN1112_c0_g1_i1:164-748(-)
MAHQRRVSILLGHLCPVPQCASVLSPFPVSAQNSLAQLNLPDPKPMPALTSEEWKAKKGQTVCVSEYLTMNQERISAFAVVTGDPQWIHGPEAKKRGSPFGAPIAHGFLLLSLASYFGRSLPSVKGVKMGVNYGIEKLRFISPVRVGDKIRMKFELQDFKEMKDGLLNTMKCTLEIEGQTKPALSFEWLTRVFV